MPEKAQHKPEYRPLPELLKQLREEADLTQRAIGDRLGKPQSWVYNCETGLRRVDVTEFVLWAEVCGVAPKVAFNRLLQAMGRR